MKFLSIAAATTLAATSALAHPGHVAPEAGHSHGEVLAVLALVGVVGAIWALRTR